MANAEGLILHKSDFDAEETLRRLLAAIQAANNLTLFAHVDHSAGAQAAGLSLRAMDVVIFGNARAGTPLLAAAPTLGLDLPLRMLVWEADDGAAWTAYNDPVWLAGRHGLSAGADAMAQLMASLARIAIERPPTPAG
jgi:uncharacterized protein (DUF302 family)